MNYVIIVAGGKGLRMGGEIPKQFIPVHGKPILMRTVEAFHAYDENLNVILVLPASQQDYWKELCQKHRFSVPYSLANGGKTRFESSKNGLSLIPNEEEGMVGIHDGVRPFVSKTVIRDCFRATMEHKAAIPVIPVTDTLRRVDEKENGHNVLRSNYRIVQTPQVFDIRLLKKAFSQPYQESFTDDASVVEALGHKVYMVEGNKENIKITTPLDLKIAEILVSEDN